MRILVGVKRVIDYAVKVRVAADKKGKCLRGQMGRGLGRGLQTPRRRCPKAPLNCQAASSTVTTGQPQVRLFPVSFAKYAPHSLLLPFLLLPPPPTLGVELNNVKHSMNPFCEIAVEEAVRLKEKKVATEIVAVSVGPKQAQETLRTALAMGVDRSIHIETSLRPDQEIQPLAVAKILSKLVEKEKAGLIILGKQSIDGDYAQTAPMLAALLGWPQATFSAGVEPVDGNKALQVERETDTGSEVLKINLPAVISTDLRLNTPR